MTAEIVNLRRARKVVTRQKHDEKAAQNRVIFGTPKVLRQQAETERDLETRRLDGHRRTSDDGA